MKNGINYKLREKRIIPMLNMVKLYFEKFGYVSILDIGGSKNYWDIVPKEFLERHMVKITCLNLPNVNLPVNDNIFTFVNGDGCNLTEFKDNQFHIAHSNSVIEHVGDWSKMIQFSNEIRRVADSYFVQTPNYWFPIEPHWYLPFFHWLPRPLEALCLMTFPPMANYDKKCKNIDEAMRRIDESRLLSKSMFSWLFPDATIKVERYILLSKSFVAVRNGLRAYR